ncbi:hypothetical protein SAMN05444586_1010100 [Acinetobacter bohemicus]|uniref:Uncharacterized protein n=1 Tax=Acinetobacter bohemicus TaxID=1435036 RepID=A0A1I6TDN5_9GAMM|nr:hypothetical protein SAMN05444586_1010100 [Acinetobacter bohemicus]
MHTILPHQVLIAFAVTLLAGLATVIGGALGYFILALFMMRYLAVFGVIGGGDGVWMNYYPQQSVMPKVMKPFTGW